MSSSTMGGHRVVLGLPTLKGYHHDMIWPTFKLMTECPHILGHIQSYSTYLPDCRNICVKQAFDNLSEFTHLLFIDDDMTGFTAEHVQRFLDADKPIIGGAYVRRKSLHLSTFLVKEDSADGICECWHVGTGFMLIKREVLEKTRMEKDYWFLCERTPRETILSEFQELMEKNPTPEEIFTLGRNCMEGGQYYGEDVYFCNRARKLGFPCFVDIQVQIGHIGERVYTMKDLEFASFEK